MNHVKVLDKVWNFVTVNYQMPCTHTCIADICTPLHRLAVSGFKYTNKMWFDDQPDVVNGDGDGTVNLRSLHGCLRWQGKNGGHDVKHQTFDKVNHMAILDYTATIDYIKTVLYS